MLSERAPLSLSPLALLVAAALVASVGVMARASARALPTEMRAVQAAGVPCEKPFLCVSMKRVPVPRPAPGELLVAMKGASVNPITIDLVGPTCLEYGHCTNGTLGSDGAGVVVGANACDDFEIGDEVWVLGGMGLGFGDFEQLWAEFATVPCGAAGLKPKGLSFVDAGTIPLAGAASLQCLRSASRPLTGLTIAITSGQGGTGAVAIQLAKAFGASRIITAATGEGIAMVRGLGADDVIDFATQGSVFDTLPEGSVDVVFDNLGRPGTADAAMRALRAGGEYLLISSSRGGQPTASPKDGVRQVGGCSDQPWSRSLLDTLAELVDAGKLRPHTMRPTYALSEAPQALTRSMSHGVLGKIALEI